MLLSKQETVEAGADLARARARISKLPPELQAVANQLGEPPTPTDPEPDPEPETKEQLVNRWVAEATPETEQPEPQPEQQPIAASLPGDTASEQIANVPPVKKPEPTTQQQSEPLPAAADKPEALWREDGLVSLPMDGHDVKTTRKINGFTVSFVEAKDFKLSGKLHTGVTLKVLGEGTGSNGTEVNCSFKEGQEYFIVAVKLADGSQANDKTGTKRAEMPKHLQPLRRAAIGWMTSNFPYTGSKWEDEVNYVTPSPVPTEKQPSNAAAEPVK